MKLLFPLLALTLAPVMATAAAAQAPAAAATGYNVNDTDIGTLLDNPASKAVLDKYMPGFSENPQVEMARGMTLKVVQQFASDMISDEALAKIQADLSHLPAQK